MVAQLRAKALRRVPSSPRYSGGDRSYRVIAAAGSGIAPASSSARIAIFAASWGACLP